jgi:alpha-galactosidase
MQENSVTRRDFMRLTAGAVTLEAASAACALKTGIAKAMPEAAASALAPTKGPDTEMAIAEDWAHSFGAVTADAGTRTGGGRLLPERLKPPFSFNYDGRESADLLPSWSCTVKSSRLDSLREQLEVTYTDPATSLQVRVVATRFTDFPAVEWVVYFKNCGRTDTPILKDIQALDVSLCSPEDDPTIHHALGAHCSMNDFMPMTRVLGERGRLELNAGGGRSSSDFLPFFNVETKGEGVVMAIGWTGEWASAFQREEGPQFNLRAGMALTHLTLHAGEEIRTPKILMLFWLGQPQRGHNLLRRFILAHHRPAPESKPLMAPICNYNWGATSAARHMENIRQLVAHDLPFEYYWIDAGWFGVGEWWKNTGDWMVKKDLYPEGFKPISDLLHSAGRKLLVWFEPERVCEETSWYTEHGEWLLEVPRDRRVSRGMAAKGEWDIPASDPRWVQNESRRNQIAENDKLFNLGIPEARQFLTDFISARIDEFGLDCYRHDANIAPLEFWRAADTPNRQGLTEIRWVEGLYAFWDALRERHPNLIIDDCASGGRRIDLETIGRSTAFSWTDYVGSLEANQCHRCGLLRWVPLCSTLAGNIAIDTDYRIRSSMTTGLCYDLSMTGARAQDNTEYSSLPFAEIKRSLRRYREIQRYFYGDFYPLTEYTQTNDAWMAYQFDLPESGEGLLVVLKRPLSEFTEALFAMNALQLGSYYEIANVDSGDKATFSGKELMEKGLAVTLLARPDSALLRYRRKMQEFGR